MRKFIAVVVLCLMNLATSLVAAETARVATKETAIRADAKFFAPVKATARYQDTLTIIGRRGDWFQVKFRGTEGFVHKSAIEEKSFSLGSMAGKGGGASSDEVALAGKGFNPQVEASYKQGHPDLDFRTVNQVGQYQVPAAELEKFIAAGGLNKP